MRRDDIGLGSMADLRSFSSSLGERPKTPLQLNEAELLMQESPAPSSFAKRMPKHTDEALKLHHSREHLGTHPYRVVLTEVGGGSLCVVHGAGIAALVMGALLMVVCAARALPGCSGSRCQRRAMGCHRQPCSASCTALYPLQTCTPADLYMQP
jgi:hypothetical protein